MIKEILVLELFLLDSCLKVKWQRWVKTRVIGCAGSMFSFLNVQKGNTESGLCRERGCFDRNALNTESTGSIYETKVVVGRRMALCYENSSFLAALAKQVKSAGECCLHVVGTGVSYCYGWTRSVCSHLPSRCI